MTPSYKLKHSPIPSCEQARLAALYGYEILDSPPEAAFDRIVSIAARLFGTPMALVSLVDADRQWFKAKCGLDASETPRDFSFCAYAMLESAPMVICDATRDPRFQSNPLVTGEMSLRFYVGAVIRSTSGLPLGTLCVIDTQARESPAPELIETLEDLAFLVSEQLEFRAVAAARTGTEREHQKQLEAASQTAEAANRAKSDFLARMSHEIRTPMNLIMGMNALLLESPLNDRQRQHIEISYRNVRRLLRLINGILDLSKVEAGELIFHDAPFDLDEHLSECVATISDAIERAGLEFKTSISADTWRYWTGDAERLQQVLLNLVGNSIKFTEAGKVTVAVGPETDANGQPGLRFEVTDTGCGVPKDKSALIFEPFRQVEETLRRTREGTGLGLSIAKTLVERMGGRIWVEETPEPGAKFVFTVFLKPSTREAAGSRAFSAGTRGVPTALKQGQRILLVEDNPENVVLMQAYLENLSISLDLASNGVEAVEKRLEHSYDLILMDIQMPVMDGYTATQQIRLWERENGMSRVPIIALTAHAFNGASAQSLDAGCDGHLTKPVERMDLLENIAQFATSGVVPPLTLGRCHPKLGQCLP